MYISQCFVSEDTHHFKRKYTQSSSKHLYLVVLMNGLQLNMNRTRIGSLLSKYNNPLPFEGQHFQENNPTRESEIHLDFSGIICVGILIQKRNLILPDYLMTIYLIWHLMMAMSKPHSRFLLHGQREARNRIYS